MGEVDTFGVYVRRRLERWGEVFALSRDCEYLGFQTRNMLQVLIDHRGEMPARATGYKPLEVDAEAMQIETIVSSMAQQGQRGLACVLRAYYCGLGRRKIERFETANLLLTTAGLRPVSQTTYLQMHDVAVAHVRGVMVGVSIAA